VRVCPQRSKFLSLFAPRYYMLWQDDVYSMADLKHVQSGSLLRWMQEAAAAAEQHVMACTTCSAFGHFCEICRSDALLFAFQVHVVAQCGRCKGFFHSACLRSVGSSCPRCARRRDKAGAEQLVHRMQRMQVICSTWLFHLHHPCVRSINFHTLPFPLSRCLQQAMNTKMQEKRSHFVQRSRGSSFNDCSSEVCKYTALRCIKT
jgi:hypothetical protein